MTDDLVSIITPAYRAAGVIAQTIASVQAQTHTQWELLIADDCSPDDTRQVVAGCCAQDRRIQLITLARNGGPAAARNAALARAQGRWLAFLDSDDLWLPHKLERCIAAARAETAALVFTGFRRISADGAQTGRYIAVPPRIGYTQLLGNTAIATSTVLLDRRQTGDITMQAVYYDDFVCWLALLKRGLVARGLDEDLMRYRVAVQSVSRNKKNSALQVWKIYRETEKLGLPASLWYFAQYAVRGWLKYRRF
jgi:teichuronic acid biosynthesis glycosyltransferase TuaG